MATSVPFTHPLEFRRRRDFSQKFNAAFDFLRAHLQPLLRGLFVYVLPIPIVTAVVTTVLQYQLFGGIALGQTGAKSVQAFQLQGIWPIISLGYLLGLLQWAAALVVVNGYIVLRMDTPAEQPVTVQMIGHYLQAHLLRMMGAVLMLGVVLTIGWFLCLLPGIWLSPILALAPMIMLREGGSSVWAITRARELIKGKWWSTFGLLVVSFLLVGVLQLPLIAANAAVVGLVSYTATSFSSLNLAFFLGLQIVNAVVGTVLLAFPLLTLAFQYFNLVERREGTGAYSMLDELGQPTAGPGPADWRPTTPDDEGEY